MRLNPRHTLRRLGHSHMIVDGGVGAADLTNVYTLNDTAAYLWQAVKGREFDADTLVGLLTAEYDVDTATAAADVRHMLAQWQQHGLIEG